MLASVWNYLRRRAAESVLLGVGDAVAELEREGGEIVVSLPAALQERLTALPLPEPEGNGRKKAAKT